MLIGLAFLSHIHLLSCFPKEFFIEFNTISVCIIVGQNLTKIVLEIDKSVVELILVITSQ